MKKNSALFLLMLVVTAVTAKVNPVLYKHSLSPAGAIVTQGPYLQKATSSGITFRWQTDIAVDTKVSYGTNAAALNQSAFLAGTRTDHSISITGLLPFTKYFYSIENSVEVLQVGPDHYFVTSPTTGTAGDYNFWVTGDCGDNSANQKNVRDQYNSYIGTDTTHAWLTLGDNAYNSGTDAEFAANFFDVYEGSIMKHAPLWPCPGNHDYANDVNRQNDHSIPYYTLFEIPTLAEAGGVASNTEAFYSYDYGNVHFLSLDSYGKENNATRLYDTLGAQVQWIKQDLQANTQPWIIAYWHHPPYTMGSHNSDTEAELINTRQNFIKILERYRVDLILCGHSHDYERSKLMKGHYGAEATFDAASHQLSPSSGRYDGSLNSCTYLKDSSHTLNGTIYIVSGSAGKLGGTQASFPHDAMYFSDATHGGSLIIKVKDFRLDAKWLCADGVIRDQFTLIKNASKVKNITVSLGSMLNLKASWTGDYQWAHSAEQTQMVSVAPTADTKYVVSDQFQCVADTFNVKLSNLTSVSSSNETKHTTIYPNPFQASFTVRYNAGQPKKVSIELINALGLVQRVLVKEEEISAGEQQWNFNLTADHLASGMYFIAITTDGQREMLRVIYSGR
jgi:acid phosphatase type 7